MSINFYTACGRTLTIILMIAFFTTTIPANARFLQEDPMGFDASLPWTARQLGENEGQTEENYQFNLQGAELNQYRYVGNNPIMLVDPTGKFGIFQMYTSAIKRVQAMGRAVNLAIRQATATLPRNAAGRLFNPFNGRFMSESAQPGGKLGALKSCAEGFAATRIDTGTQEPPSAKNGLAYLLCYFAGLVTQAGGI